jgi:hypothetical protein
MNHEQAKAIVSEIRQALENGYDEALIVKSLERHLARLQLSTVAHLFDEMKEATRSTFSSLAADAKYHVVNGVVGPFTVDEFEVGS